MWKVVKEDPNHFISYIDEIGYIQPYNEGKIVEDDFTGEKVFVVDGYTIPAEKYIPTGDKELDKWMTKWFNLFKCEAYGNIVLGDKFARMRYFLTWQEIENFPGVKNPLLIAYVMRKIQIGTYDERVFKIDYDDYWFFRPDKLEELAKKIDENVDKYSGVYKDVYLTN
ncbi:MAG: hypothetical protein J7L52_06655, partial [Thermotogae bacterium]|nr:hypothetical protein [Thermotogota bacterium]